MSKFRIEPHGRLQEWVAEEKGYFKNEGLDYEFVNSYVAGESGYAAVQSAESAAPEVKRGGLILSEFDHKYICGNRLPCWLRHPDTSSPIFFVRAP